MTHYSIGEWTDFVRNLVAGERFDQMAQHLADGCQECKSAVGFLREVVEIAALDQLYEQASSPLSERAHGVFAPPVISSEPTGVMAALRTLAAQLTFNSASALHPAGARGNRPAARQLMYQAGDYCVDLRVDRDRNTTRVVLVGQVANEKQPLLQLARLPVFVMAGKKILSETASNEFGEFTLEFLPRPNLRLCVQVTQAGVQLEVPLKRSLEEHET